MILALPFKSGMMRKTILTTSRQRGLKTAKSAVADATICCRSIDQPNIYILTDPGLERPGYNQVVATRQMTNTYAVRLFHKQSRLACSPPLSIYHFPFTIYSPLWKLN